LYSTSVTDSFELLSQVFDYLKTLNFDQQEIMRNFFDVTYFLAVEFAIEMKKLIIVEISSVPSFLEDDKLIFKDEDMRSVTETVLVKINNIASSVDQLIYITDYFFSTSYKLDLDKTIGMKEGESIHSLNEIIDEAISILANKFEPKISAFFIDFVQLKDQEDLV
jgi:hypothetical protein